MIIFGIRAHYSAIGGVENSVRFLIKEASARNIQVTLVCGQADPRERHSYDFGSSSNGVTVITYKDDIFFSLPRRLLSILRGGVELKSRYKNLYQQHKDAIVIVRHHSHALAAIHAGFTNVKYLVPSLVKDQLRQELKNSSWLGQLRLACHILIDGFIQERALKTCQIFVFSKLMRTQILESLPHLRNGSFIKIVKPGIDAGRFSCPSATQKLKLRKQLKLPLDKTLLLFVGRIVNAKGLDYFVSSISGMSESYIGIIVGAGERKELLKKKIKTLGVEKRFIFTGFRADVERYFRACDVFVMSSTYEPLGQTIIEAASCGLPVVAFKDGQNMRTATQELNLDFTITYAKTIDSVGLRVALDSAVCRYDSIDRYANSVKSQKLFSWSSLLDELLI